MTPPIKPLPPPANAMISSRDPTIVIPRVLEAIRLIDDHHMLPTKACDHAGISYSTVKRYAKEYDELGDMLYEAETRLYEYMAEALVHINEAGEYGSSDPKMAAIISKNIQWLLARRRKEYVEKTITEVAITADKEVLGILQQAKMRAQSLNILPASAVAGNAAAATAKKQFIDMFINNNGLAVPVDETPEERYAREFAEIS